MNKRFLFFCVIFFFTILLVGCTTNKIIMVNPNIEAYVFSHTNETIELLAANEWTNVTFGQEVTDIIKDIKHEHNSHENDTFIILIDGVYEISYNFDVQDTSPSASNIDVAARVILDNGTEILGSVFETDIIKQEVEVELTHNILAKLKAGDKLILQFIASDEDVEISTHGTFGEHPDSASIIIERIDNLN